MRRLWRNMAELALNRFHDSFIRGMEGGGKVLNLSIFESRFCVENLEMEISLRFIRRVEM